ncbi:MAG: multifunctional CCA tRNA nucleotidyl transferase/2'3'-cyclic phosphodiesterase/2'nucleotidase/phosphatase [Spongiibacteraceae bacterium]
MKTYLVGGAVRDKLLGYPHHEHDWVVVGATPEEMLAAGFKPVGKDFPVFLHPKTNEEYALARTERKTGRGYHGFNFYCDTDVTLEQDLERRDLTINAIAEDEVGNLFDPYGGQRDIEQRILRHVSSAFAEDPLRILRVARFAARYHHLGFRVADETMALMRAIVDAGEVEHLVSERIWKETERALGEPNPEIYFYTLQQCGAAQRLFPDIPNTELALKELEAAANKFTQTIIRFAVLCSKLNSAEATALCSRICAPNDYRELVQLVIEQLPAIKMLSSADAAFIIIEQSDALRRPKRFELLLETASALRMNDTAIQRLHSAYKNAAAIIAQPLLARGFKGKELGEQIRRERLAAVQRNWS